MSKVIEFPKHAPSERSAPECHDPSAATPEPLLREAIGAALKRERHDRGERIVDIADRAGIAPQYLSEIERGRKDPSSEVLSAITGALGLRMSDLLTDAAGSLGTGPACLAA